MPTWIRLGAVAVTAVVVLRAPPAIAEARLSISPTLIELFRLFAC